MLRCKTMAAEVKESTEKPVLGFLCCSFLCVFHCPSPFFSLVVHTYSCMAVFVGKIIDAQKSLFGISKIVFYE